MILRYKIYRKLLRETDKFSRKLLMLRDEFPYRRFGRNLDRLNKMLYKLEFINGKYMFTYPYLDGLQAIWRQYYLNLRENFGFDIIPDDIVIDIGAHHGIVALNCAYLGAKVIAYEPHPVNYEILKRNLAINKNLGIHIENKAVFSVNAELEFNFGQTSTTGALKKAFRDWKRTEEDILIETHSFLDVIKIHGLNEVNIKLMKVDCEGAEYDFFGNAPSELLRQVEYYYIEAHPTQLHQPAEIKRKLIDHGYRCCSICVGQGCFEYVCRRSNG